MLLMKDPKKFATLILASKSPSYGDLKKSNESGEGLKEVPVKDGAEQDASMGYEAAAESILSAVESKDKASLVSALKDFFDLCSSEMESEVEE